MRPPSSGRGSFRGGFRGGRGGGDRGGRGRGGFGFRDEGPPSEVVGQSPVRSISIVSFCSMRLILISGFSRGFFVSTCL